MPHFSNRPHIRIGKRLVGHNRATYLEILMYQTVEFLPVVLLGAAPEVPL